MSAMHIETQTKAPAEPTLGELAEKAARAAYTATQNALSRRPGDGYRDAQLADAQAQMAVVQALVAAQQIAP